MAYIEGDQTAAARETLWYAGKPEEYLSFGLQLANRNVLGQRRESGKLYKRAAETALHRELTKVAAAFEEADARADALSGNCGTARHPGASGTGAGAVRPERRSSPPIRQSVFPMELFGMRCNCL
jgi:hypothetical protein